MADLNGIQAPALLPTLTLDATTSAQASGRPDFKRPEYTAGKAARDLCHALTVGTKGVQDLGEVGLPKWPAEKQANYKLRASCAQVARYYQRTVEASVGMICSTPPSLNDDADPLITADVEDIDGRGTHIEVFSRQVATEAVNGGYAGIFVDAPPIPDGLSLTLADEQALGLRPFWVLVSADRIPSWIVDVPDWVALLRDYAQGMISAEQVKSYARQTIVRQVVIYEPTDVTQGAFGIVCKDRYRVLKLTDQGVSFEVWERRDAQASTGEHFARISSGMMLQAGRKPFREIPLAIVYAGVKKAPFDASPPLHGLAELNLDHYRVSADRRYLMRLCHAPTLFLAGFADQVDEIGQVKKVEVGPNSVLSTPEPNAKAQYVSANPDALKSSQEERDELVRAMAALGMSFLGKDRRAQAETATGRALDAAAETSTHATVARGLQDGLEQALKFHAMYRGVPAPEITVNTSYAAPQVDPQIAAVLWNAVAADKLDVESFIEYIQTGALPDDVMIRLNALKLMALSAADDALVGQNGSQTVDQQPSGSAKQPDALPTDKAPKDSQASSVKAPSDTAPKALAA